MILQSLKLEKCPSMTGEGRVPICLAGSAVGFNAAHIQALFIVQSCIFSQPAGNLGRCTRSSPVTTLCRYQCGVVQVYALLCSYLFTRPNSTKTRPLTACRITRRQRLANCRSEAREMTMLARNGRRVTRAACRGGESRDRRPCVWIGLSTR